MECLHCLECTSDHLTIPPDLLRRTSTFTSGLNHSGRGFQGRRHSIVNGLATRHAQGSQCTRRPPYAFRLLSLLQEGRDINGIFRSLDEVQILAIQSRYSGDSVPRENQYSPDMQEGRPNTTKHLNFYIGGQTASEITKSP